MRAATETASTPVTGRLLALTWAVVLVAALTLATAVVTLVATIAR